MIGYNVFSFRISLSVVIQLLTVVLYFVISQCMVSGKHWIPIIITQSVKCN